MKRQLVATLAGGLILFALQALTGIVLGPIDWASSPRKLMKVGSDDFRPWLIRAA